MVNSAPGISQWAKEQQQIVLYYYDDILINGANKLVYLPRMIIDSYCWELPRRQMNGVFLRNSRFEKFLRQKKKTP